MRVPRRAGLIAALVSAVLMIAPPALADHLEVSTSEMPSVEPGDIVEVVVVVRSAETQQPVSGASVIVSVEAEMVGVHGSLELARATTDEAGLATLRWQMRSGTMEGVAVAYAQAGEESLESHPLPIVTVGDGTQIVRSESGVRIPGFGAWVLIALVVGIWATIQLALLGPVRVALRAAEGETEQETEDA